MPSSARIKKSLRRKLSPDEGANVQHRSQSVLRTTLDSCRARLKCASFHRRRKTPGLNSVSARLILVSRLTQWAGVRISYLVILLG